MASPGERPLDPAEAERQVSEAIARYREVVHGAPGGRLTSG